MTRKRSVPRDPGEASRLFAAEAAYAQSIFSLSQGDVEGSIAAAEQALEIKPDYAPAVLTMGSIEYQRGRPERGAELFRKLHDLPDEEGDLWEVMDQAGDFLIQEKRYAEGLELYRAASARFPGQTSLLQGVACCAGHEGNHEEAIDASRQAVRLAPERAALLSDLGWCLCEACRWVEAESVLQRAVELDPDDELARENLRYCQEQRARRD